MICTTINCDMSNNLDTYLDRLSKDLTLRSHERVKISKSIRTIQNRLASHFSDSLQRQEVFGSYDRRTLIPARYDPFADVDLLLLFEDDGVMPSTYVERIRKFAGKWYPNSAIARSSPTFALELQHIRFELVPAIEKGFLSKKLYIQAPLGDSSKWIATNPCEMKNDIRSINAHSNGSLRRLIRILKYWNSRVGRPFSSYHLEQEAINYIESEGVPLSMFSALKGVTGSILQTGIPMKDFSKSKLNEFSNSLEKISVINIKRPLVAVNRLWRLLPAIGGGPRTIF